VYAIIDLGDEETCLNLRAHGSSAYVGLPSHSLSHDIKTVKEAYSLPFAILIF